MRLVYGRLLAVISLRSRGQVVFDEKQLREDFKAPLSHHTVKLQCSGLTGRLNYYTVPNIYGGRLPKACGTSMDGKVAQTL